MGHYQIFHFVLNRGDLRAVYLWALWVTWSTNPFRRLGVGATAMGTGVWAMHFIGMLAFQLPVPVAYDVGVTLASLIPAVLASAVVLVVISRHTVSGPQLLLAGTLMGLGIGAMHYTGMAAMRLAAEMYYDPLLFAVSILVAALFATAALYLNLAPHGGKEGRRAKTSNQYTQSVRGALGLVGIVVNDRVPEIERNRLQRSIHI